MNNREFLELLHSLDACSQAIKWVEKNGYSFEEAYQNCHRGDWLLWIFAKTSKINEKNERALFLAKGHCANTVRNKMTDKRSLDAVDAAIAFGEGKISKKELNAAADAAAAYAAAAAAAAYADASYTAAAAYAAAAADDDDASYTAAADAAAAYAAAAAAAADADDAAAAYAAAAAADDDDAAAANRMLTADICRKYLLIEIFAI